jgi:hypothetical protein
MKENWRLPELHVVDRCVAFGNNTIYFQQLVKRNCTTGFTAKADRQVQFLTNTRKQMTA